jgi:protein required for attachment to host cells
MTTWVLAANGTGAHIFEYAGAHLHQIETLSPVNRSSDLQRPRTPGGPVDSAGTVEAGDSESAPDEKTACAFALRVAAHLERARQRGLIARLVVIAEPRFLSQLKSWLTRGVTDLIVESLADDFVPARDVHPPIRQEAVPQLLRA